MDFADGVSAGGVSAGDLSCYTACLARYLECAYDDPLARVARSVRLAVRTDDPEGLTAFSHHGIWLSDLGDGLHLGYRGRANAGDLIADLDGEIAAGDGVIAVTYSGAMDWSIAPPHESAPHFVLLSARDGDLWRVDDPFSALLPAGSQDPFLGWISTARLLRAMTPPTRLGHEDRLRKQHVFGFGVPLPPDDRYQWLARMPAARDAVQALPDGWVSEPAAVLCYLSDFWSSLTQCRERVRYLDDMWASARHHAFRYSHLISRVRLDAAELDAAATARDAWNNLPMALRFAADSAVRGRSRPSLIRGLFEQLRTAEDNVADVLAAHGYGEAGGFGVAQPASQASVSQKGRSMSTPHPSSLTTPSRPALWFSALTSSSGTGFADRALESGRGCFVRDVSGREYLDARSALWNAALGYGNRHLIEAMTRQLNSLPVAQIIRHDLPTEVALSYAERLISVLPDNLAHVRFCTTGAQAVEGALLLSRFIRVLRGQPERTQVLALWDGYHGIGGLAGAVTGELPIHEMLAPLVPGVRHVPAGDIDALRSAIGQIGSQQITAMICEPILGTDVVELPPEYLHQAQSLCQAEGIHFILDEITTGFGRTGHITVAGHLGLTPDMLLVSKGITSGYAPLSAIAVTPQVQELAIAEPGMVFPHGSTGDGHPVAMAAAAAVLDELADGGVLANVIARGEQLTSAIREIEPGATTISVHGPGLMIAVALADADGQPLPAHIMATVKERCKEEGLLVSISNHMVLLTPPLIISSSECDLLVERLDSGIRQAVAGQAVFAD